MLALCFILSFPQTGESRILHVPLDYSSIQGAINSSVNGDTVLVNDGFYQEQVNFLGKNIVVTSRYILDHDSVHIYNTEINRSYLNEGVKLINGEGPSAQLTGFTISNSLWKAVWCKNSSPTIRNNIIRGNKADGIYLDSSGATISDNEIHCYPDFDMGGPYEAIEVFNSGPVIERNLIDGNDPAGNVHAIYLDLWNLLLPGVRTDIRENRIIGEIFGGLPDNGLPQLIHHNVVTTGNGFSASMNITDCAANLKIVNNTVTGGGGIWIQGGNYPDIRNNIVAHANTGIELWVDTATVAYNNIWDCKVRYSGIPDQTGINGNISSDPGFLDPSRGDYHFFCWSKCIDAGDPLSEYTREPSPNGGRINMGNYGNTPEADPSVACILAFPDTIDFGYVTMGWHKDTTWVILNAGHARLDISGVSTGNADNFSTSYPGGMTQLNPGDSLGLIVTFHPLTNKTHYWDSVLVTSNSVSPGKCYLAGHTALGVDPGPEVCGFEIYPVPVSGDYLCIKPSTPWTQETRVEITGIKGELVFSGVVHPAGVQPLRISTGMLKAGLYCLRIKNDALSLTGKFSVARH